MGPGLRHATAVGVAVGDDDGDCRTVVVPLLHRPRPVAQTGGQLGALRPRRRVRTIRWP